MVGSELGPGGDLGGIQAGSRQDLGWIMGGIWDGSGWFLGGTWAGSWLGSGLVSIWDLHDPSRSLGTPCSGPATACPSPGRVPGPPSCLRFPLPGDTQAPTHPNACSAHITQVPAPQDRGGQCSGAVGQPHRGLPGLQHRHRPQVPHPAQRQHQPRTRPPRQPERLPGGV